MDTYLEFMYFTDEYSEKMYPQKLCNYISENYYWKLAKKQNVYGGKLLDIGCGKGNHLVGFHRCGYEVYGLDKRKEVAKVLENFTIKECDIENKPFPYEDNTFDWIFSKSVLEHVCNTDNFIYETLRVLKPGGKAVLMAPDWESQYKSFWDDPTHVKPFTRKRLQNTMRMAGFQNVRASMFVQLPFLWKYPFLSFITKIISLLPDSLKWNDHEQSDARKLIRFSKEENAAGRGRKVNYYEDTGAYSGTRGLQGSSSKEYCQSVRKTLDCILYRASPCFQMH